VTSDFREFVVLQLGALPGLTHRAMFGGCGLWANGIFFGIIYQDKLFFRTGLDTLGGYTDAGMKQFATGDFVSTNYYEVPPDVLGSGAKLFDWAAAAVGEALKAKKKPKRKSDR
jgi:DNA transformation protein